MSFLSVATEQLFAGRLCRRQLFHSSAAAGSQKRKRGLRSQLPPPPRPKPKVHFERENAPHGSVKPHEAPESHLRPMDPITVKPEGRGRWADRDATEVVHSRPAEPASVYGIPENNMNAGTPFRHGTRYQRSDGRSPRSSTSASFTSWKSRGEHRDSRQMDGPELGGNIPNSFQVTRHGGPSPSTFLKKTTKPEIPTEEFTSPPLMPGLLSCLHDVLGPKAKPTHIQALSMKHLLNTDPRKYKEVLLASETGSGKSIAYMLPLLQSLKQLEIDGTVQRQITHPLNPRALILAPSHELVRQLSSFAKSLIHDIKLRVLCSSRANVSNKVDVIGGTASQMKNKLESLFSGETLDIRSEGRFPVDVVVGTPMKFLDMIKGRGWDRRLDDKEEEKKEETKEVAENEQEDEVARTRKFRKGRDITPSTVTKTGRYPSDLGLINVEWVIIDEADVLFDPDFQESTRLLLSEIAAARGSPVPYYQDNFNYRKQDTPIEPAPVSFPFNLVLTSATIPSALSNYLDIHHPSHLRLASPNLHQLPSTLQKEYVSWTGGNKLADIEKRVRRVWSEDSTSRDGKLSKVLIFCNKNTKVQALHAYLEEKGLKSVAIDGSPESRGKGSNRHLNGFLRKPRDVEIEERKAGESEDEKDPAQTPHVLITTSLLSRGIDFSPDIKHVFLVDEPRNVTDLLHRAGRSARAGNKGKVVIFGKLEGRGSGRAKEVRRQVAAL